MYRVATVTSALEKKQTDISVNVNLLTMKQVHRVLWDAVDVEDYNGI